MASLTSSVLVAPSASARVSRRSAAAPVASAPALRKTSSVASRPLHAAALPPLTRSQRTAPVKAAAAAQEQSGSAATEEKSYVALCASADFFFNDVQNEAFAEQLRERVRFFGEQDREIDFFFVPEPAWLESKLEGAKRLGRPAVALVSTDHVWMSFMRLRLDRVLKADLKGMSDEEIFASACNYELPPFERPLGSDKWTAPYSPYEPGWWEAFYNK
uniref:Uncharacterized protein n=1 Tax=Tetraselmis chuii TaxID=63592 RepID=A0A7S1SUA0_9CHLO|mmetsp:Transcript_29826/g.53436  ORF Transcript_29826/g.53436 Transcript_29826/m.53436 type:complete len:217 (+) Transcript_29826:65-715(+)